MANPSTTVDLYPGEGNDVPRTRVDTTDTPRHASTTRRPSMQTEVSTVEGQDPVPAEVARGQRIDAGNAVTVPRRQNSNVRASDGQPSTQSRPRTTISEERRATPTRRPDISEIRNNLRPSSQDRVTNGNATSGRDRESLSRRPPNGRAQTRQPHRLDFNVIRAQQNPRYYSLENETTGDGLQPANADSHDDRWTHQQRSRSNHGTDAGNFRGVRSASPNHADGDNEDIYVVPALPMPIAITCCILNFTLPGVGSMCASMCFFCCARADGMSSREKLGSCCTVFGIGVLQLLLVACFLIGWIWSCIWGITFIGMSANFYHEDYDDYDEEQNRHRSSRHNAASGAQTRPYRHRGRTPLPTPQVVTDQPFPGVRYEDMGRRNSSSRRRSQQLQRTASRRHRSPRIPLTPSNLIYPMRAPSNIAYSSPPPPYQIAVTSLPGQVIHENSEPPPPAYRELSRN